ncbi:hypothetical protein RUND412_008969 [Rhizina undulata]
MPQITQLLCPICDETEFEYLLSKAVQPTPKWMRGLNYSGPSAKVEALMENLRVHEAERPAEPEKSVVFSSWTKMLDLRKEAIDRFRGDPEVNILLMSLGAGGVGLNLTAASRVHILEPQWNPMVEQQALDCVLRIGQEKQVITTRYVVENSIEESILTYQQRKLALAYVSFTQNTKTETVRRLLKELRTLFR